MERRNAPRYRVQRMVRGKLYNVVHFQVHDISLEGINIISNFQPTVGETYSIFIQHGGTARELKIAIVRAEVAGFLDRDDGCFAAGTLFSIGARFSQADLAGNEFLLDLAGDKPDGIEAGFIDF